MQHTNRQTGDGTRRTCKFKTRVHAASKLFSDTPFKTESQEPHKLGSRREHYHRHNTCMEASKHICMHSCSHHEHKHVRTIEASTISSFLLQSILVIFSNPPQHPLLPFRGVCWGELVFLNFEEIRLVVRGAGGVRKGCCTPVPACRGLRTHSYCPLAARPGRRR